MDLARRGSDDGEKDPILLGWRQRALNAFTAALAALHLPFVLLWLFTGRSTREEGLATLGAWSLNLLAALARRASPGIRLALMVAASWGYSLMVVHRSGVFLNFRLALLGVPLALIILAGPRWGLSVGGLHLVFLALGFLATEQGWLPQAAPPWGPGEWVTQTSFVTAFLLPLSLLLAWFGHHFASALRREQEAVRDLEAEVAERERMEVLAVEAGEQESRRIGEDLHDGVCQDLTGLLIRSKRAQRALEARGQPESAELVAVVQGLGEAIGEIHGVSRRLSPGALTGGDLVGALDDLVRRTQEVSEASLSLKVTGDGPAPSPFSAMNLYRVAQEALANALRYSQASRVGVELAYGSQDCTLLVEDDGRGLPDGAREGRGLGLQTMGWRAARCGGELKVEPREGGGTRVWARLPSVRPRITPTEGSP